MKRAVCQVKPPASAQNTHKNPLYFIILRFLMRSRRECSQKHINLDETHIYIQHSRRNRALCLNLVEICAIITLYSTISTSYVRRLRSRLHIRQRLWAGSRRVHTGTRRGLRTRLNRLRNACIQALCMI